MWEEHAAATWRSRTRRGSHERRSSADWRGPRRRGWRGRRGRLEKTQALPRPAMGRKALADGLHDKSSSTFLGVV